MHLKGKRKKIVDMSAAEEDKIRTTTNDVDGDGENTGREDCGKLQYGCDHYRRRCKIQAPCCNRVFTCRYCHNETMEEASVNPEENHALNRHDVKQVICAICNAEQEVAQLCSNCGVKFGEYFCDICKLFDDDKTKDQFHCNDCGICRVGGRENFFHCSKCGSCYSMALQDNHLCIENSMKNDCPICYEFLFDSLKATTILKCGHSMHMECYNEMMSQGHYRCPICFKSATNLSSFWERLDEEIKAEPMPKSYRYKFFIFCNDCNKCSKANFHRLGLKCGHCSSYNTRRA